LILPSAEEGAHRETASAVFAMDEEKSVLGFGRPELPARFEGNFYLSM
jgi:hypothetical protein